MPPAFFENKIAVADFRELLGTNRTESALNEQWLQWLDVGSWVSFPLAPWSAVERNGHNYERGDSNGSFFNFYKNDKVIKETIEMKKQSNKLFAFFMACMMLVASASIGAFAVDTQELPDSITDDSLIMGPAANAVLPRSSARSTLQQLQAKFPHGKYWNHVGGSLARMSAAISLALPSSRQ